MNIREYGYEKSYIVESKYIVVVEDLQTGLTRYQILDNNNGNKTVSSEWFNDGKSFEETEKIAFKKVRELLGE